MDPCQCESPDYQSEWHPGFVPDLETELHWAGCDLFSFQAMTPTLEPTEKRGPDRKRSTCLRFSFQHLWNPASFQKYWRLVPATVDVVILNDFDRFVLPVEMDAKVPNLWSESCLIRPLGIETEYPSLHLSKGLGRLYPFVRPQGSGGLDQGSLLGEKIGWHGFSWGHSDPKSLQQWFGKSIAIVDPMGSAVNDDVLANVEVPKSDVRLRIGPAPWSHRLIVIIGYLRIAEWNPMAGYQSTWACEWCFFKIKSTGSFSLIVSELPCSTYIYFWPINDFYSNDIWQLISNAAYIKDHFNGVPISLMVSGKPETFFTFCFFELVCR